MKNDKATIKRLALETVGKLALEGSLTVGDLISIVHDASKDADVREMVKQMNLLELYSYMRELDTKEEAPQPEKEKEPKMAKQPESEQLKELMSLILETIPVGQSRTKADLAAILGKTVDELSEPLLALKAGGHLSSSRGRGAKWTRVAPPETT